MENNQYHVLLTGATSGIGRELAKLFAKDGHPLIIVGRDENTLQQTAAQLQEEGAAHVHHFVVDFFDKDAAQNLYNQIKSEGLAVGTLVNNAGQGVYGLFVENNLDDELNIVQLNIAALVTLTKLVSRDMVKHGQGRILNLASIAGKSPGPWQAVYHGTKAFVHSFSEALHYELKDSGITVTSLLPGATDTDFFAKAGMENSKAVKDGELADPAQVAKDGYEALLAGKDMVVSGFKNKVNVAMGNIIPDQVQAKQTANTQEPSTQNS